MQKIRHLIGVLLALVVGIVVTSAKEQKVKLEDCPAAVQKTIKDNANGGKIVEIEKEVAKNGTVLYEAEVKMSNSKEREIVVGADGTLIKIENEDDDEDEDEDEDDDKDEDDD